MYCLLSVLKNCDAKNETGHAYILKNFANNLGKFGVPSPVTGSQPVVAVNPGVPHPWLPPLVISFSVHGFAYSVGLMKPTLPLPTAKRASLIRVMIEPTTGAEAEVP